MVLGMVSVKQLRAKKPHWCKVCGGRIQRGQEYIQRTGISKGFSIENRHVHCDALATAFQDSDEKKDVTFTEWIFRNVCSECTMNCDAEPFPFACRAVIEKLVPETVRGAAIQSLEEAEHGA